MEADSGDGKPRRMDSANSRKTRRNVANPRICIGAVSNLCSRIFPPITPSRYRFSDAIQKVGRFASCCSETDFPKVHSFDECLRGPERARFLTPRSALNTPLQFARAPCSRNIFRSGSDFERILLTRRIGFRFRLPSLQKRGLLPTRVTVAPLRSDCEVLAFRSPILADVKNR